MKDLLATLWEHVKNTTAETRIVIASGVVLVFLTAGWMAYRSANPRMVPAFSGLDNSSFSAVTNALATAGIRFDASSPPGPFIVFVPADDIYKARNAVATHSALDLGSKGIDTSQGVSSIFDPAAKRLLENNKRDWQDLEKQLEAFTFVQTAVVRASGPPPSPFRPTQPQTVSVVVRLRGSAALDSGQRRALASTVRNGAHVPEENITITDQNGQLIFDGAEDQSLDEYIRFEKEWADLWTARAQAQLDTMFGPGLTKVSVSGEFDFSTTESVNEAFDPTKLKVSENATESKTPIELDSGVPLSTPSGGPAGLQANLQATPKPLASGVAEASESQTSSSYVYGRTTTHTEVGAPLLKHIAISLAVHDSLKDRLAEAEQMIKGLVRFDPERDELYSAALPLASVTLDDEGQPVLPTAEPAPEPPSRIVTLLIEHGVEILAAGAFLLVLLRSLRRGVAAPPAVEVENAAPSITDLMSEEELDMDLLARKHVEQMLEEDPEKVASLLSRWALGENFYAKAKS